MVIEFADRVRRRGITRAEFIAHEREQLREQLQRSHRRAEAALARAEALRAGARTERERRLAEAAAVRARVALDEAERDAKSLEVMRAYAARHGLRA